MRLVCGLSLKGTTQIINIDFEFLARPRNLYLPTVYALPVYGLVCVVCSRCVPLALISLPLASCTRARPKPVHRNVCPVIQGVQQQLGQARMMGMLLLVYYHGYVPRCWDQAEWPVDAVP